MPRKVYHVTKSSEGWKGTLEGSNRASVAAPTKAAVLARTIELAKQAPLSQVVIHGEDHKIQSERTYCKDPRRSPG